MKKVFISGSISIKVLNKKVLERLNNIIEKEYQILLGDADGVDKNIQVELMSRNYKNVHVYCSGASCRNNVGNWETVHVEVPPKVNGRKFFTFKDEQMARDADYGFLIWDGKSAGTLNNLVNLVKSGKTGIVYFSQMDEFVPVKDKQTFEELLKKCNPDDIGKIDNKVSFKKKLSQKPEPLQEELQFTQYAEEKSYVNREDLILSQGLVNESHDTSAYPASCKQSILDFLQHNLISDLNKMVRIGMDYYAFNLLCSGLELLGSFFDQKELTEGHLSTLRIDNAIDKLFPKGYRIANVRGAIENNLRHGLVHQFTPTGNIALTSETTSNCPRKYHLNKGLSPDDKRIIFVIEQFIDDFKNAIAKLINEKNGKLKPSINALRFEVEFIYVHSVIIGSDVITTSGGVPYKEVDSTTI
ncbi:MAG: hypothetical protein GX639_08715 [Fibrobacter sp.]|nr:hypothetical protein [Fibrobacter sp.]